MQDYSLGKVFFSSLCKYLFHKILFKYKIIRLENYFFFTLQIFIHIKFYSNTKIFAWKNIFILFQYYVFIRIKFYSIKKLFTWKNIFLFTLQNYSLGKVFFLHFANIYSHKILFEYKIIRLEKYFFSSLSRYLFA